MEHVIGDSHPANWTPKTTSSGVESHQVGSPPRHAHDPESAQAAFEARTYQMARGSETPDGSLEGLALHHDHGKEGPNSKAAHQVEEVVHQHEQHTNMS